MRYVDQIMDPDEEIRHEGRLHWIIYLAGALFLVIGLSVLIYSFGPYLRKEPDFLWWVFFGAGALAVAAYCLLDAWIGVMGTELVVTNKRIIHKSGLIYRKTIEMNLVKVESVLVDQSIIGRMLGYGTITIRGTGTSIEPIRMVVAPLKFRSHVTSGGGCLSLKTEARSRPPRPCASEDPLRFAEHGVPDRGLDPSPGYYFHRAVKEFVVPVSATKSRLGGRKRTLEGAGSKGRG